MIRFISKNKFQYRNRLLWPRRTVDGAEEGVPLRAKRMKKGQNHRRHSGHSLQVSSAKQFTKDKMKWKRKRNIH